MLETSLNLTDFQTISLLVMMGGYVYSIGKFTQSVNGLDTRMSVVEEELEDLRERYPLSNTEAIKYLHTHAGCKTVTRG